MLLGSHGQIQVNFSARLQGSAFVLDGWLLAFWTLHQCRLHRILTLSHLVGERSAQESYNFISLRLTMRTLSSHETIIGVMYPLSQFAPLYTD